MQGFVAAINGIAMSSLSFIKNCVSTWSDFQRLVPKGGLLAAFLVGWPQLLPEYLCQQQMEMDFTLDGWAQRSASASWKWGLLASEMYEHIILFDQRGILSLASDRVCSVPSCVSDIFIYCPYLSCFMELGKKQSPKVLKSSDP